jgi:hypothetical protein
MQMVNLHVEDCFVPRNNVRGIIRAIRSKFASIRVIS